MSDARMNLVGDHALVVDHDQFTRDVISQMLRGFGGGLPAPAIAATGAAARAHLKEHCADICICEAALPDTNAGALVRWIRRQTGPIRFIPVIVLTGYTQTSRVALARDSGATIVVKKPVSARVLFDHIAWAAKSERAFVEAGRYVQPTAASDAQFRRPRASGGSTHPMPTMTDPTP